MPTNKVEQTIRVYICYHIPINFIVRITPIIYQDGNIAMTDVCHMKVGILLNWAEIWQNTIKVWNLDIIDEWTIKYTTKQAGLICRYQFSICLVAPPTIAFNSGGRPQSGIFLGRTIDFCKLSGHIPYTWFFSCHGLDLITSSTRPWRHPPAVLRKSGHAWYM